MVLLVLVAVLACCGVTVYAVYRMLLTHQSVMAAVIGKHAQDARTALGEAESRISETARTGVRARSGPARLHD
jgi:hypothetical protein